MKTTPLFTQFVPMRTDSGFLAGIVREYRVATDGRIVSQTLDTATGEVRRRKRLKLHTRPTLKALFAIFNPAETATSQS